MEKIPLLLLVASVFANLASASYYVLVADSLNPLLESQESYLGNPRAKRSLSGKFDIIDSFVHEDDAVYGSGQDSEEMSEEFTLQFLVKNSDPAVAARTTLQEFIPSNAILTDFSIHNEGETYVHDTRNGRNRKQVSEDYQKAVQDGRSAVMLGDVDAVNSRCTDCRTENEDGQQTSAEINIAPGDSLSISISYVTPLSRNSVEEGKASSRADVTISVQYPAANFCGVILSPNYPEFYPNDADLTWLITVPSGLIINTTLLSFQTETCCDHLYTYDGPGDTYSQLAVVSGSKTTEGSVVTTGPDMFVKFQSDMTVNEGGFAFQFCTTTPRVNDETDPTKTPGNDTHTVFENQGTISSPGYPFGYPPSSVFSWVITASADKSLVLDTIDLDMLVGETLSIHDDLSGKLLQTLTASNARAYITIEAPSNKVLVVFTTVEKLVFSPRGFLLRYYSKQAIFSCNYELDIAAGDNEWKTLSSPNYPSNYENNADCIWNIRAQQHAIVSLEIQSLELESVYDTLVIYDSNITDTNKVLATLSGYGGQNLEYLTTQSNATIFFSSDSSVTFSGFQIMYRVYPASRQCSAKTQMLESAFGIISNLNFPGANYISRDCQWMISAPDRYVINAYVEYYDGNNNYLTLYDGDTSSRPILWTGYDAAFYRGVSVQSSSNNLLVRINKANGYAICYLIRYTSFSPNEDDTCKSQYVLTEMPGVIKSPLYPRYFTNHTNCQWLIQAPPAQYVMLYIDNILLSSDDSVVFYDGSTANNIIRQCYSSYCSKGTWITSSSNSMLVIMTSGTPNGYFKLKYDSSGDVSSNGLVFEYDEYSGYAVSPYFPSYYSNDFRTYSISVPSGYIVFNFEYFVTEECCDHLTLYDGDSTDSLEIAFLGGDRSGFSGQTSGSFLTMYFETDSDGTGGYVGFKMTYCEPSRCSSLLPQSAYSYKEIKDYDEFYFFSPGSLGQYPANSDFYWYIQCDKNYEIIFYFYRLDLDASDFVTIYSGFGTDSSNLRATFRDKGNYYTYSSTSYVDSARATVWFHSGPYFNGDGFVGRYYC